MNELIPPHSAHVVIGVCGEQGSGKTVFLTCVFQSIWTAFPDDVILDFDRDKIGNADYFRDIEDRLIETGTPAGTSTEHVYPARIYVKPSEPLAKAGSSVLSVDIQDFAGGHFRSLANLNHLGPPNASDSEETVALRAVNDTLMTADAFVILINAKEIDPLNDAPKRNPFSPSVNFLLSHCRAERKPVALLFSQSDQTGRLTEEVFRSLPRVQAFERQFTSDLDEAADGKRPYGIVRKIACYETVDGDLAPKRQTMDGNIWLPDPAEVVLDLLRAATSRINLRLARIAEEDRLKRRREELAKARAQAMRRRLAMVAAAVLLLLIAATPFVLHVRAESRKLQLLTTISAAMTTGRLASLSSSNEVTLREILDDHRNDSGGSSSDVRIAIRDLHTAFAQAAQRLATEPAFDATYADELTRFRRLAPILDPENTAEWRPTLVPLLEARTSFLSEWFAANGGNQERAAILENAIRRFALIDTAFAKVLANAPRVTRPPHVSTLKAPSRTHANAV